MTSGLGFRIFGGLSLVIVLTLGVAAIVFFSLLGGYRDALDRNTLQRQADQVLFGVSQFAERNSNPLAVSRYLERQSEETGALVFILDAEGLVVADLSPGAEFVDLQLPVRLSDVRGRPTTWIPGVVEAGDESLPFLARLVTFDRFGRAAFVAVAVPDTGNSGVVDDLAPRLLISGLAGLMVALIVGLAITRSVYRPLQNLTNAVGAIGRGRYDTRVPVEGPAETQALARAVNRMTEQVEENEATLQQFMADVSHELRTPLTSIRGFTQSLVDGTVQSDEQRRRSASVIDDEARRMLRLVEELLDLSRMQAGEFQLQRERVDPGELLAHVHDVFSQRVVDAGIELVVEAPTSLPTVEVDFDRMVQVLTNLVDNAIQYTPEGSVTIAARREGSVLSLLVRDTGEGIAAEDLALLFDRFYRGQSTARRRGTGLGLAIAREIVRAHGGEMEAHSAVGVGTTFRITLPVAAALEPQGEADPAE